MSKKTISYMFADLETDMIRANRYLEVKTCALIYESWGKTREYFTTSMEEFIEFIVSKFNKSNRPVIYFHNMQFDFAFMFKEMIIHKLKKGEAQFIIRGSQLIAIKFYEIEQSYEKGRKERKRCIGEIRDSYALLPTSLRVLGESLKFKKQKIDFKKCSFEELKEYNLNDCYVLKKAVFSFVEDVEKEFEIKIKNVPLTIASFSRTILRKFYETDYSLKNDFLNEHFRQWYFGGRTEVFDFNLWDKVKDYDINSLYPFVMQKYKFPYELSGVKTNCKYEELEDLDFVCLEARIREKGYIPLIPEKIENKLVFREGIKTVLLWKEEIDYLQSINQIEIYEVEKVYYGKQDYLFKEFVQKNYNLRKRKDKPFYNLIFKLILNSSYGKFAERTEKEELVLKPLEEMTTEDLSKSTNEIDGVFIIRETKKVRLSLNVPIASKITALSRMVLHKRMMKVLRFGGKLIYCDTDSIFTDDTYFQESNVLGDMKLEADLEKLICLNAKEYAYNLKTTGRIKMKGFINKEGTVEEFLDNYLDDFHITRKTTFKESLKKYSEDKDYFRYVEDKIKRKRTFYCKRIINKDLTTRPLTTLELPSEAEKINKKILMERYFNEKMENKITCN